MHTIIEEIPELKDTVFDHFMDQLYQLLMVNRHFKTIQKLN